MTDRKLNILLVSAEVAPIAKVGGLADVAGGLPKALRALGHDVRIAMPAYKMIEKHPGLKIEDEIAKFSFPLNETEKARAWVKRTALSGIPVYMIGGHPHFTRATESKKIYSLEADPYLFFNRAVMEFVPRLPKRWIPDIVHCNDWQTGFIPVYLETLYRTNPAWSRTRSLFTIHNLAYQGNFEPGIIGKAGLPDWLFTYDKLEFYGQASFMKGGLAFADQVNTVSTAYAQEIGTPEYGCRLDGLLRYLWEQGRVSGIVNGIDFAEYDPATDKRIPANYSAEKPAAKSKCKAALRKEFGLAATSGCALIGFVGRLSDQKGLDLIRDAAEKLLSWPVQLVVLGTGDPEFEAWFQQLAKKHPKQVGVKIGFDAELAQRIYAGSDFFLMPSKFEPCGLGQMMSFRYGTVPIVRATGGLSETVQGWNARTNRGNGFTFAEYSPKAMLAAIEKSLKTFGNEQQWKRLVQNALTSDYSWAASAQKYADLYRRTLATGVAQAA